MDLHQQLENTLHKTALSRKDVLPVLRAYKEHISDCPICRRKLSRLIENVFNSEDAQSIIYDQLESLEVIKEPPYYPVFNHAKNPELMWDITEERFANGKNHYFHDLKKRIGLNVRINFRKMEITFDNLTAELANFLSPDLRSAPALVRDDARAVREKFLTIPDLQGNLAISLAFEAIANGKTHLHMNLRRLEPDKKIGFAQITLEGGNGKEVITTREGKTTFLNLVPAEYHVKILIIEQDNSEHTWRFNFTLQPT